MVKPKTNKEDKELLVEAVDLEGISTLEETFAPITGCGCGSMCHGV